MRHVVCALLVACAWYAAPATAAYFISEIRGGALDPFIDADGSLRLRGEIVVREEPCRREHASLQVEMWALRDAYWPDRSGNSGYRLVTFDLPKPTVVDAGACASTLSVDGVFAVDLPPPGTYERTYFLRVSPSGYCDRSDCYESFANTTPYGQLFVNVPPKSPDPAPAAVGWLERATAVEYYHAQFNHYFMTSSVDEINALDAGRFAGWSRTGETLQLWASGSVSRAAMCRFFGSFQAASSHFYTPFAAECAKVKASESWDYEGVGGYVDLPALEGACPFGPQIYRLYNAGKGGAPNHRYTSSADVRLKMLAKGWISEGYGDLGVVGCSPR